VKKIETSLPGVFLLEPQVFGDARGFFMETYSARQFADFGITTNFVQDNHSRSSKGVLRGLHYQLKNPQSKLCRVVSGSVFDVAVDIRPGSPTFGRWIGAVLSAENKRQIFVPRGFAHGFLTLEDGTEFLYKCDDFYTPGDEYGIRWNDDAIGIEWPFEQFGIETPLLSGKDEITPLLRECERQQLPIFSGI
jgi:dTDP-4-dehydrorhamnose 3,5-epimerase